MHIPGIEHLAALGQTFDFDAHLVLHPDCPYYSKLANVKTDGERGWLALGMEREEREILRKLSRKAWEKANPSACAKEQKALADAQALRRKANT